MIALGFDPGYGQHNVTGWAVIDTEGACVVARGKLKATGVTDDERLASLVNQVAAVIRAQACDVCVYELPVHGPNQRSIAGLARVCGVILACATLRGLPCVSVQPAEAKQALTGRGNATKQDMIAAAWRQFALQGALCDAEADAIGIALAGEAHMREARHVR